MDIQSCQHRFADFLRRYYFEIIHAFKTGIAVLIAYFIYIFVPHEGLMAQWVFVTIIVVMSANSTLGGQVNRSLLRMAATLAGCALALLVIFTPGIQVTLPVFLFLVTFLFIFIAVRNPKYGYLGTLGAVTFCMIALSSNHSFDMAVIRTSEILLGILISLVVSRFVFPIRSIRLIKQRCFLNLSRIAELYEAVLIDGKVRFKDKKVTELENEVIKNHQLQRELRGMIKYESRKDKLKVENISLIIRSQSALYNYFSMLAISKRIIIESDYCEEKVLVLLRAFVAEVIHFIQEFIACYPKNSLQDLAAMQEKSQQLLRDIDSAENLNPEAFYPLHTLCFTSKRIIQVCDNLTKHIHNTL